jgi:hypothetical protein
MFGTKRRRAEQQAASQASVKAIEDIKPSQDETETAKERAAWRADKASSKDVTAYEAMKPYLGLYEAAIDNQVRERQGTGILNLADKMNPTQAANYKTYMQAKKQQDAAGRLENAYASTDAMMRGEAFNWSQIYNQRNLGKAGVATQAMGIQYGRPGTAQQIGQILGPVIAGAGAAAAF